MDNRSSDSSCRSNNFFGINRFFIIFSIIMYTINQLYLKGSIESVIIMFYLNDFLAMILVLAFSNLLFIKYLNIEYTISDFNRIMIFSIVIGFFWEVITPLYNSKSTGDILDILAYLFGGLIYWLILKLFIYF